MVNRVFSKFKSGMSFNLNSFPRLCRIPLSMITSLSGKSHANFYSEITGISASRLRPGSKQTMRNSTLDKAKASAWANLHRKLVKKDWTTDEIENFIASTPSRQNGHPCVFGDLVHGLSQPGSIEYPLTGLFAKQLDDLENRLEAALHTRNAHEYKAALCSVDWVWEPRWWTIDSHDAESSQQSFDLAQDWPALEIAIKPFIANILLSYLAAMDLEFFSNYFPWFRLRPLFLDLMPTLSPKISLETINLASKWGRFRLPTRRLLELSHALHYKAHRKAWPLQPVGRSELAQAVDQPDTMIGNLFDGTKKLTFAQFDNFWGELCKNVSKTQVFLTPTPWLMAAQFWQSSMVEFDDALKIRSLMLSDGAAYMVWWNYHRQNWASQLPDGTEDWPQWLGTSLKPAYS